MTDRTWTVLCVDGSQLGPVEGPAFAEKPAGIVVMFNRRGDRWTRSEFVPWSNIRRIICEVREV